MTQELLDRAGVLMGAQRFRDALALLRKGIDQDPTNWGVWYMAGQCCRFLDDIDSAIEYLSHAVEIKSNEPAPLQALGIALQLRERWDEAIEAFARAIQVDADFELAYNSLALTQQKRGDLDKALENYDAGAKALARRIVKAMRNSRSSPILKHRGTLGTLWAEYATFGALYLAASAEGVASLAWPTGQQAQEEEASEEHAGLYWVDLPDDKKQTVRLFLPNYFNTFRESLRRDSSYSHLIGNRGTVLELLGRGDEAIRHFEEAREFALIQ